MYGFVYVYLYIRLFRRYERNPFDKYIKLSRSCISNYIKENIILVYQAKFYQIYSMYIRAPRVCDWHMLGHFIYFYLKSNLNVSQAIDPVLMESLFNFGDIQFLPRMCYYLE